jgi:hypothetical protein
MATEDSRRNVTGGLFKLKSTNELSKDATVKGFEIRRPDSPAPLGTAILA